MKNWNDFIQQQLNKRELVISLKELDLLLKQEIDQLYKEVEGLPFTKMDLGKNWDAGEWINKKDVLTLIEKRMI